MSHRGKYVPDLKLHHPSRKNINFSIFVIVLITISLSLVYPLFYGQVSAAPSKRKITNTVNELNFLSSSQKEALVLSIVTGARDGLLDYHNKIGTKTLLKALKNQDTSRANKVKFIKTYKGALQEDLPVYLVTKTTIRLFRTGAPFDTVLSTVKAQVSLLRRIGQYLRQEDIDLYLTHEDRILLIDTLAESIVTYSRQTDSEGFEISGEEINKLKQTTENMVKFSSLPVSFQQGTKGGSTGKETNPQLTEFLRNRETIKDLAELAQEFYQLK